MTTLSPWRIEWLRLVRTRRLLVLVAVFVFFGFAGPLSARYLADIIGRAGNSDQIQIIVAAPVPADGIDGFISNGLSVGAIVSVVIAASACAIDANTALAIFYRTRVGSYGKLLLPRLIATIIAVVAAFLVGLAVAWYETAVLIGAPSVRPMLASALLGSVYLAFAVAMAAAAGAVARTTLGTVGLALAVVLLLPILGQLPGVGDWLPTSLANAPTALMRGGNLGDHLRALTTAIALSIGLPALAAIQGNRREAA